MRTFLFLFMLLYLAIPAHAASTMTCHCFQDRQYLPQQKHAADPYFLTTTQNALMAVWFGVEKRSLVKAKMSGTDGDTLWIAHYLARQSDLSPQDVGRVYAKEGNWESVIETLDISSRLDSRRLSQLDHPDELAASIVDATLAQALNTKAETLDRLRAEGLGNKELILAVFLARVRDDDDPLHILRLYQEGQSWGKLLHDRGLSDSKAIEQAWRVLLTD